MSEISYAYSTEQEPTEPQFGNLDSFIEKSAERKDRVQRLAREYERIIDACAGRGISAENNNDPFDSNILDGPVLSETCTTYIEILVPSEFQGSDQWARNAAGMVVQFDTWKHQDSREFEDPDSTFVYVSEAQELEGVFVSGSGLTARHEDGSYLEGEELELVINTMALFENIQ